MPSSPLSLENALRLHKAGQLAQAEAAYRKLLKVNPASVDALNLLGVVRQQQGDHVRAVQSFTKALAVNGRLVPIWVNRGISHRALGEAGQAQADFARALEIDGTFGEGHLQLGNLLKAAGRHVEAEACLRRATEFAPGNEAAWLNLGVTLLALSRRAEAIACFESALALAPDRPEALNVLGSALLDAGRLSEAKARLERALELNPGYAAAHDNLGRALRAEGLAAEALNEFRISLAAQPNPGTHSNLVYALNFVPGLAAAEIAAEHRRWAAMYAEPIKRFQGARANSPEPGRRLRVGYLSPDFVHHAVAYFIEPVLARHRRTEVEVFCYANVQTPDDVTARLQGLCDVWRDISRLDDEQAAALILEDRIDILLDLAGHTAHNRLPVQARKPAPLQGTWLGYPNTTGMSAIDFRLTDAGCDAVGETDSFYTEKLVRLPGLFSCYRPSTKAPEVSPPPAAKNGWVTFGSFNHFAKIHPGVLDLWVRVLGRIPASRLLLRARSLADEAVAGRVRSRFAAQGVDPARLIFDSRELPVAEHLAVYAGVDIALDPFPYNGTTTTCEALWMGVPVVTLRGSCHVSRVTADLVDHLGHPEWIAADENDYVDRCERLAGDVAALTALRSTQRERMRGSPLCDEEGFVVNLETAYRDLWRDWCAAAG